MLKILLRSYGTLFEAFTKIQESIIAKRAQLTTKEVKTLLNKLKEMDILDYIPQNSNPKILFLVTPSHVNGWEAQEMFGEGDECILAIPSNIITNIQFEIIINGQSA
ncbi:hypothetical protein N9Y89_00365 [bacterium]|nr:hypothetical protein [bacterium]